MMQHYKYAFEEGYRTGKQHSKKQHLMLGFIAGALVTLLLSFIVLGW